MDLQKLHVSHEDNLQKLKATRLAELAALRQKSDLRNALDSLKGDFAEARQKLTPGIGTFEEWMSKGSIDADSPIIESDPFTSSGGFHNVLAHNSLLWSRSKNWDSALVDAVKSIEVRPSATGYIAKALALAGKGEPEEALQVSDLTFMNCNADESSMLLLIKAIVVYLSGKYDNAISRIDNLIPILNDEEMTYCCIQVLGKMHLMQGKYEHAVRSLERACSFASSCDGYHLETISTLFGWTFDGFKLTMQRYRCELLCAEDRVEETVEALRKLLDASSEEIQTNKATEKWVVGLKKKCVDMLERLGDVMFDSKNYEQAIKRYSSALYFHPSCPTGILVKRSKAQASKGSWEEALIDANEVIKLDPSLYQGYERKCMAFFGAENYGEANNALLRMLSIIEKSEDEEIRRLREDYSTPREAINTIIVATNEIFRLCPLVLIDLTTGQLCDAHERVRIFHSEMPFKKLVSEASILRLDYPRILQAVAHYFKWTMFSHTWEGKEPTFQDVNQVDSIWKLDQSPLNEKLHQFCTTAHEDGHRWAWSDTCCIDKTTSAVLSQSLTSMYTWYEEAAETLVHLADVQDPAELGDLRRSRWMTRAWTLQELLASKVIRFYTREWKLYLNDAHRNHKESPSIKQELAQAMGVAPETITRFHPEDLGVREKLRLASTRNATVEEDIAYSLVGIFSSDIVPRYGLGKTALGHLLENIVARTGDVTVIAWTGKSLSYNSALPDSLSVYNRTPYTPPSVEVNELDARVEQLRTELGTEDDAINFYKKVIRLPRATFSSRCLQLPCIWFSVKKIIGQDQEYNQRIYRATIPLIGKVEFKAADAILPEMRRRLVFIHPWLRDLHDPLDEFVSDDEEAESQTDWDDDEARLNAGWGAGSDESDVSSPAIPSHAGGPLVRVDRSRQALRLVARLERPFNALLLERQNNGQYKRIATEEEIILPGITRLVNTKDLRAKVMEIV